MMERAGLFGLRQGYWTVRVNICELVTPPEVAVTVALEVMG